MGDSFAVSSATLEQFFKNVSFGKGHVYGTGTNRCIGGTLELNSIQLKRHSLDVNSNI